MAKQAIKTTRLPEKYWLLPPKQSEKRMNAAVVRIQNARCCFLFRALNAMVKKGLRTKRDM